MKRFTQKDTDAIAKLLWESPEFDEFEMGGDPALDDGMEFGMEQPEPMGAEVVMEFEPDGPIQPEGEPNEVLISDLKKLAEYSERLQEMATSAEFDDWMIAKITKASDYVSDIWHRLDARADFANTGFEQAPDYESMM